MSNDDGTPREGIAGKYDEYLLHVVGMICRGDPSDKAAAYLTGIASEHMGLSVVDADTATATVHAIADYLRS